VTDRNETVLQPYLVQAPEHPRDGPEQQIHRRRIRIQRHRAPAARRMAEAAIVRDQPGDRLVEPQAVTEQVELVGAKQLDDESAP
jgi:hypothetical protein